MTSSTEKQKQRDATTPGRFTKIVESCRTFLGFVFIRIPRTLGKEWVAIVAVLALVVATADGLMRWHDYCVDRPIPKITFLRVIPFLKGNTPPMQQSETGVFLSLCIANRGKSALTPLRYELRICMDGKWDTFEPVLLGPGFTFEHVKFDVNPRETDLNTLTQAVTQDSPLFGNLAFKTRRI